MTKPFVDLSDIVERVKYMRDVRKVDVKFGDFVLIITMNSAYSLYVLNADSYLVSGGFFDRMILSPLKISVAGCTWGRNIIKSDTLAACGMCLEFSIGSGRIITSPIQQVFVAPVNRKN